MGMAEFFAPHYRTNSVTDAGGRLLGWTDQNGSTLNRVGGGVTPAGGNMNVFAYADATPTSTGRATMRRPQPQVAAALAADQAVKAKETKPKSRRTSQLDLDRKRAAILRGNPGYKKERWARELMERHPSWFVERAEG